MRRLALCLLVGFAPLAGEAKPGHKPAQELLRSMELLCAKQKSLHPLDAPGLDPELKSIAQQIRALGPEAVPLLSWHIRAKERPLKVRVYSAALLGMIGDPAGLPALKAAVEDESEDAGLRSAALQSIGTLGLAPHELRPFLEKAAGPPFPEPVVREALSQLAGIGSGDLRLMEKAAKSGGPAPEGLARGSAAHALAAIGRSGSSAADALLVRLLGYYKRGSPLRGDVVAALGQLRFTARGGTRGSGRPLSKDDIDVLTDMAAQDPGPSAAQAARFLRTLGDKRAVPALCRALRTARDPEAVAEIAEALASIGDPQGARALARLEEGLIADPRFKPEPGKDPRAQAARIERASALFRTQAAGTAPLATTPIAPAASPPTAAPPAAAASVPPALPLPFRYEGWPGSGKPKLAWDGTVRLLPLRSAPERAAPEAASVDPPAGELLDFDRSVVVTRTPGRVMARRALELEARLLGERESVSRVDYDSPAVLQKLALREGDTLEVLSYREEGSCFLRKDRTVYLGPCPQDDRAAFALLEEPRVEWWLHAAVRKAEGWFDSEQKGLEFLPRW